MNKDNILVFATGNDHKLKEVNAILEETMYSAVAMKELGVTEDIPEDGSTLHENAAIKANYLLQKLEIDCFAEDSGLEIEALDMAPGIYTARYGGPERDHDQNMDKVLSELEGILNRKAQFRAVIALNLNGEQYFFEGIIKGEIALTKQGEGGFGYDPIFIPKGHTQTFAELSNEVKNTMSHRYNAVKAMCDFLVTRI